MWAWYINSWHAQTCFVMNYGKEIEIINSQQTQPKMTELLCNGATEKNNCCFFLATEKVDK